MKRTSRLVLLLLALAACGDPTLIAGDGLDALSEGDAAVDARTASRADASEDGRVSDHEPEDPRDLWGYLPKSCRNCASIRLDEECPFTLPRTIEDIEKFGCYECGCCEEQTTCRAFPGNLSCIPWSGERGSIGMCRPTFRGGGVGPDLP